MTNKIKKSTIEINEFLSKNDIKEGIELRDKDSIKDEYEVVLVAKGEDEDDYMGTTRPIVKVEVGELIKKIGSVDGEHVSNQIHDVVDLITALHNIVVDEKGLILLDEKGLIIKEESKNE